MTRDAILANVRRSLGRSGSAPLLERPPILPPRPAGTTEDEIHLLIAEINKLSGSARRVSQDDLEASLAELVAEQRIQRAVLWPDANLQRLRLAESLQEMGVEVIPASAGKDLLATCDLGITGVDYALPETGTLALLSSPEKPRPVSLLPRVHLAIISPASLRPDLHQVFSEVKGQGYLILITGPSRTADIELTVTLGVHGPKALYAWVLTE